MKSLEWVARISAMMLVAVACTTVDSSTDTARDIRIVVVTHGQSSDPFWSVVANGVQDAGADLGIRVEYQAPNSFDMVEMNNLIDAAVASRPNGLVVSIPDADALGSVIRAAADEGLPVLSINSGGDVYRDLGVLAHIGQPEYEAGRAGGERLAAAGVSKALCVNHEVGNLSLDIRCQGLADALSTTGGSIVVLAVDLADPDDTQQRVAGALSSDPRIDGVLTLGPNGAEPTLAALRETGKRGEVEFGTFDLSPSVLAAVRDGEMLFAIDQHQYLQGYLAIVMMVKFFETGALPGGGSVIPTGPGFVTVEDAADVIALSERGVR
ncbi:sugar ABC transporter substrate-binding protein [Gemmatimonadota bacterium]